MTIRKLMMFSILFLLVYCAYAGKGSVMGPLLGVAAVTGTDRRKQRILELKGLIAERDRQRKTIFDKCDAENRLEDESERAECIRLEIEKRAFIEEHDFLKGRVTEAGSYGGPAGDGNPIPFDGPRLARAMSLGQRFVESEVIQDWRGPESNPRQLSAEAAWQSPAVRIGTFFPEHTRDLVTAGSSISAGALIIPDYQAGIEQTWRRPLVVRNLITNAQTGSNLVDYFKETFTNNAKATAEATGVNDGSGALPQSKINFELVQAPVQNVGHYIVATVQALMDAAQTRSEIDSALRQGIEEAVEDLILGGDGLPPNFKGILNEDINLQAFDTDIFVTARRAKTKAEVNGKTTVTGYVFSPTAMEDIDLGLNNIGQYYAVGAPFGSAPSTLWGVPRVQSQSPAVANYGVVGDFRKAWLWDRLQSEILLANQHMDFATRLITAIIGVYRGAFGVKRPKAFTRVALS